MSDSAAPARRQLLRLPRPVLPALRRADPALARLMKSVGAFRMEYRHPEGHLAALVRSIVYQQLSGKAAATIFGRFRALFPGPEDVFPTPAQIRAVPDEQLRACGLSGQKLGYLRDLCARAEDGRLDLLALDALDDEAIVARLTEVRGFGRWSAEMFLMFHLGRLDVWPVADLGIRKGVMLLHGLTEMPGAQQMQEVGARYRPYATVASWYLWRLFDLPAEAREALLAAGQGAGDAT